MAESNGGTSNSVKTLYDILQADKSVPLSSGDTLYVRFQKIKEAAPELLQGLGKNGIKHSSRIEEYLEDLSVHENVIKQLTSAEVFILLCAAYLHDIGYLHNGKLIQNGHPRRSHDMILSDLGRYKLGDFPSVKGKHPLTAQAVAQVCHGHEKEILLPLASIPTKFSDAALSKEPLNLKKLTALLRLADEADDAYIRLGGDSGGGIRDDIPLVSITGNTIIWHWNRSEMKDPQRVEALLQEKKENLATSLAYLSETGFPRWYLVMDPQTGDIPPLFMPPPPVTTFVGHAGDLKKLHTRIKRNQQGAITGLVGTGGIGKTELALMYAEQFKDEYPDGVFWVSLKGSIWRSEAVKVHQVLRPWEEPPTLPDDGAAQDAVQNLLNGKKALLIIDNVNEAEDIALPGCPVLVTTRNKTAFSLILPEAVHELPGLTDTEGSSLLKKVLGAPRVKRDEAGAKEIVRILGGMPLALDIAARHLYDMPSLSFPDYIGEVKGKLSKLTTGDSEDRDVVASLMLSVEQLTSMENGEELLMLFEASGVCAESGFDYRAVWATAGLPQGDRTGAARQVETLHRRSLLLLDEKSGRYSMHPLVRELSLSMAMSDETKEKRCRKNHCTYFLAYARGHEADPRQLIEEKDNLWQAMIHAIRLGKAKKLMPEFIDLFATPYRILLDRGEYEQAFRYLVAVNLINVDELGESKTLVKLLDPLTSKDTNLALSSREWMLTDLGTAYLQLGEYRRAFELHEKALKIARRIGNVRGEGSALGSMGLAYSNLGEYQRAIELYEKRLKIARRIGDIRGEGSVLGNMGTAYLYLGEYRRAIELYEQRLEMARRIGDVRGEGNALGNMGNAYMQLGEHRRTFELYEKALEIARRIGNVRGEGNVLGNMGLAYANLGEYQRAIELYEKALEIDRSIGNVQGEGNDLGNMGLAYANLGEYQRAIELYEKALEIDHRIGYVRGEGNVLGNMGLAYAGLGEYQRAIELYEKALEIDRSIGNVRGEGNNLVNMGNAYVQLGDRKTAEACFRASRKIFKSLGLPHMVKQVEEMMKSLGL